VEGLANLVLLEFALFPVSRKIRFIKKTNNKSLV